MKRLLKYLKKVVAVFAVAVVSCTDYGGRIEELQRQIDELAEYCNTLNANAEGLGRLIEAVRHGDTLVEFGPISEDGAVVGFRAVFESAGEVVVYNQDTAVSIGEENGRYYWMAGGDWMKDANGNRIEISALSALPLFKVEDETLKVSTDGGTRWSALGNMDTSMITSVEEDAQKVVFTFAGGATVVVPKYQALGITLAGDDATISAGGSVEVGYTITGDSNATVNVICGDGWEATVTTTGEATGTITVTAPNPVSQDKVIVICSDSQGRMVAVQMRLSIDTTPEEPGPGPGGDDPMLEVTPVTLAFGSEGGSESVTVVANVGYAVVSSASWVTAAKATDGRYTITAAANANTSERTAVVTFAGAGKSTTLTVTQAAATLLVPVRTAIQLSSSGGTVTVGLNTNTEYTVTTDAFWLRYMGTRALRTDQLTFSAEANTGNARTATATITAENYSTGIVFTQDGVQRYINLSTYAMNFDSEGGSATLTVNANVGYTWSVSSSWLSFTASGGNQFTVTVPANTAITPRSATVTFSGDDAASKTLTVYQSPYVEPAPVIPRGEGGGNLFVSSGNYNYRYGPSIIRNSDGSLDVWTSKEGVRYSNSNSDLTYQETGSRTKVSAHGHTIAQYFNTQHRFMRVMVSLYGTGTTSDAVTLKLYQWAGSYEATIAAAPLNTLVINNTTELTSSGTRYSIYKDGNHTWMSAGEYMWTATGASQGVGVYKYPGEGTIYLTDSKSYLDGALASGYNFQAKLRGSAYNSSNFVDSFAYFHSADGGTTWSKERDAMYPTEGSEDHFSCCDPGAACFGGWYYMAYTSAPSKYNGTFNHCYVARSKTPVGPWYKWNGSGWGGEPAKVITFTGSTSQWGAGEPSIVVKDNTVYFYYTWTEGATEDCPTTRLATAPLSENWPAHLTIYGTVIDKAQFEHADSCDIKYVEDYDLFYAFHTYNRYRFNSEVAVWTSKDGKNFTYRGNMSGVLKYLGNMGVSGDGEGHIRLSEPQFIGYSYGSNASGNWNTWFGPMYFD